MAAQAQNIATSRTSQFAADVYFGLSRPGQKELSSKYLYDAVGSALFEVICELPEYGLTRAEERLLQKYSRQIVERAPHPVVVAELGSGTGRKTRLLLEALSRRQSVWYQPIEISPAALAKCRRELSDIYGVHVSGLQRDYLDGLREVALGRAASERLLVLFLGSTIGNFAGAAGAEFLGQVRAILEPGDALLLGADLRKPVELLLAAYDDPLGVTAAFNKNLLTRINRDLGADFDLHQFEHRAIFNAETQSIEMHLESTAAQWVTIPDAAASFHFEKGETIWTESCHKYSREELEELASKSGFQVGAQWIDAAWGFAENLWIAE